MLLYDFERIKILLFKVFGCGTINNEEKFIYFLESVNESRRNY